MNYLNGIDLQDSFVLGWSLSETMLVINVEFSIWPDSPYYDLPKKNEYTCYKVGRIIFSNVIHITGLLEQELVKCTQDIDGSIDYGNIDYFDDSCPKFRLVGEFGDVVLECSGVQFQIRT